MEDAFYSELGMMTFRFVMSWMVFGILGVFVLMIPLYILDNYVPSIPMDIKENEYFIMNIVGSYLFTILHVSIVSASNSWIVKNLNQIPKLSTRMAKVENTLKVDQTMQKAQDNENLLLFAKFISATLKEQNPELYEKIMEEIKDTKIANEISIKRVGTETYRAITELRKEFLKSQSKVGHSFNLRRMDGDDEND